MNEYLQIIAVNGMNLVTAIPLIIGFILVRRIKNKNKLIMSLKIFFVVGLAQRLFIILIGVLLSLGDLNSRSTNPNIFVELYNFGSAIDKYFLLPAFILSNLIVIVAMVLSNPKVDERGEF